MLALNHQQNFHGANLKNAGYILYMAKKKTKQRKEYMNTKELGLPSRFAVGFLDTLDKRSIIYQGVRKSFNTMVADMGGADNISHARLVLIERYCFGEILIQNLEAAIIEKPSERRIAKWSSITKVLNALAVRIGLDRQTRPAERLESYVVEKSKKSKKKRRRA